MSFRPDLLAGRTALVTGGGTGICRGIAMTLAAHGCDVAITSRRAEHLEPTALEIRAMGRRAVAVPADVRDPAAVEAAVTRTVEELGGLDILVNGAAGNFLCLAEQLSPNGFGAVVDIDLKGTFHCAKAALPYLKRRGGVVLNISATLHYLGTPAQVHVASAKAGVDALPAFWRLSGAPTASASTASPPGLSLTPKGYGGYSMRRRSTGPRRRRRCSGLVSSGTSPTPRCSCAPRLRLS